MTDGDGYRLARPRDAMVLVLRAIRDRYKVLSALGIPITPASRTIFRWLLEPPLIAPMKRKIGSETSINIGYARRAQNEMKAIADEFCQLVQVTSVSTPAPDRRYQYLDPTVEPFADGSADLSVNAVGVWMLCDIRCAYSFCASVSR